MIKIIHIYISACSFCSLVAIVKKGKNTPYPSCHHTFLRMAKYIMQQNEQKLLILISDHLEEQKVIISDCNFLLQELSPATQ